jgi:hypothetical protein
VKYFTVSKAKPKWLRTRSSSSAPVSMAMVSGLAPAVVMMSMVISG